MSIARLVLVLSIALSACSDGGSTNPDGVASVDESVTGSTTGSSEETDSVNTISDDNLVGEVGEIVDPVDGSVDSISALTLSPPPTLPINCIGVVDKQSTTFCVNPETREFSATGADGDVWWHFILPGENNSKEIESVHETGNVVVLLTDLKPSEYELSASERATQYEVSVFDKGGAFQRTIPLTFDLQWFDDEIPRTFEDSTTIGANGKRLPAVAFLSLDNSPHMLIGWNRFYWQRQFDFSGIAQVNLSTGIINAKIVYPDQGMEALSVDSSGNRLLRIVTSEKVEWRELDSFNIVPSKRFTSITDSALIDVPYGPLPQLNGSNYKAVIDRILPWVNADFPRKLMFGTADGEQLRQIPFPYEDLSLLNESGVDDYDVTKYGCSDGGLLINRRFRFVAFGTVRMDQCRLFNSVYTGLVYENYVGRDGYRVKGQRLKSAKDNGDVLSGSYGYGVNFSRVARGSTRTYSNGTFTRFDGAESTNNVVVTGYDSMASFFHYQEFGGEIICDSIAEDGVRLANLWCTPFTSGGSIDNKFQLNASWTSYSNIQINSRLEFGGRYYPRSRWEAANGGEYANAPDITLPNTADTEFYFRTGTLEIAAEDGSRIVLTPLGADMHPMMSVQVFDLNGVETGNYSPELIDVKCADRLGECVKP